LYSLTDKQKEYPQISSIITKYMDQTCINKKPQKWREIAMER